MLKPCAHLLCTFTLSLILCAQAQADIHVETTTINSTDGHALYQLPTLHGDTPAQQAIAQHINLFLLFAISNKMHIKPEEFPVDFHTFNPEYLPAISYSITHQTAQYLSLQIFWHMNDGIPNINNYTFDLHTGNPIAPDMLLTQQGNIWINDTIEKQRTAAYENLLSALSRQNDLTPIRRTQKLYEELQSCFEWNVQETAVATSFTYQTDTLQLLPNQTIAIEDNFGPCATFASLTGLPTLNVWRNTFTHAQLQPYLSLYGRCILSGRPGNCTQRYPNSVHQGIWTIPLPMGHQLTLIVLNYSPDYLGMGDDLYVATIYDQQQSTTQIHSVHNYLHSRNDFLLENTTDDSPLNPLNPLNPLFIGNVQYITPDQSEHFIGLAFYRDGQWKPYP